MVDKDPNTAAAPADATILRPRPGAGRRPAPATAPIVAMPVSAIHSPASQVPQLEPPHPVDVLSSVSLLLEHVRTNPARYIDLIELLGVCLASGFQGKYRLEERSHAKLGELQREVANLIRDYRPPRYDGLSPHWRGAQQTRNPMLRFVPWWIVAVCALVVLVVGFVWFHTQRSY
jgi:hypothetical protein